MWEGMFLQNLVHANWTSVCLRFSGKIPFFAWCTMHWDPWIIHVILKPGLDYLRWKVWALKVLYWEDKPSHLDLDEQTGSNMAFCCWFLSLGNSASDRITDGSFPSITFQTCMYGFCYFILPRLSHYFVLLANGCLQCSHLFAGQLHHGLKPLFVVKCECEDADTRCDGCLSLALLPLPLLLLSLWLWGSVQCWFVEEKNPWWLCAIISENSYSPGSWWRGLRRNYFAPWAWKCWLRV